MAQSIRLNKQIRADILDNIMSCYDTANPVPVRPSMENSLNDLVKEMFFTKHAAIFKEFNKLNADALECVRLADTNNYTYIQYQNEHGNWQTIDFTEQDFTNYKIPYDLTRGCFINLKDPDQLTPELTKAIEAKRTFEKTTLKEFIQKEKEHSLGRRNYRQQIETVLGGVNTSKQLTDVWPEVEKFIPVGLLEPSKIQLPSVNIATLNSALIK
jgi:hypothetical protein